jgi:predicted Holliday junction resolvase-like endonuclease
MEYAVWAAAVAALTLLAAGSLIALGALRRRVHELEREFDRRVAEEANRLAQSLYDRWVREERERVREEERKKAMEWAELEIRKREREIRRDAISRSVSVVLGRVSEHLAPLLMAERLGLNPKDLRFLGTPVDYIAFKGLSDGRPEEIIFIEVKSSATTPLTAKEEAVRRLVEGRRVRWVTFRLHEAVEEAKKVALKEAERLASEQAADSTRKAEALSALRQLLERLQQAP